MKIFQIDDQKLQVPENAHDILAIIRDEKTIDVVNYSCDRGFNGMISIVPCSRLTGRGYGHVTLTKTEFDWLQQTAKAKVRRPIAFVRLTPATA